MIQTNMYTHNNTYTQIYLPKNINELPYIYIYIQIIIAVTNFEDYPSIKFYEFWACSQHM